jgi:hypothetical protein
MDHEARIAALKKTLKQRDARILELTGEHDADRALFATISETMKDMNAALDLWIEAFDTVINERGEYHWRESLMQRYDELVAEHRRLLRDWNKFVPQYNAAAPHRRNFGRPLGASPSQRDNVPKRRKANHSLQAIAGVGSLMAKAGGVDRATLARLEHLFPNKLAEARERRNKRLRDGPPCHITEL